MEKTKRKRIIKVASMATACVVALGAGAVGVFGMPGGHRGPPQKDMVIDGTARAALVAAVADNVTRFYVYSDQGARMAAQLRAKLQHGDFDAITSADKFSDALTQTLRAETHDRHLEVGYQENVIPVEVPGQDQSPADAATELAERKRLNFGFETVGRLKCDIGYIDLHGFGRPDQVRGRLEAAMTLLADTRALIIDLRHMHGGDPDTVMMVASYFYDKPTHLNDIWFREENHTDERWTTATVPGAKYGQARPIWLLTSEETFSAGEDFAYALKNNGRALVVGETTGGGAHPGGLHRLSDHFIMNVPSGRSISPVTHTDWEGTGVTPDVRVSAKKALDVAQLAALRKLLAIETEPEWQHKIADRIAELD
jgi:hypothetical protein